MHSSLETNHIQSKVLDNELTNKQTNMSIEDIQYII